MFVAFWVDLILHLFISHVSRKLNIIEHTENTLLRIISDVVYEKARFCYIKHFNKVLLAMINQ